LIAPVTDWKPYFAGNLWHVRIDPDSVNGLSKPSAIDALQLRGVDEQRFIRRLGYVADEKMAEIAVAKAIIIELA
jgi:mRNA interferase MazF